MGDLSTNFNKSEFACKHCGLSNPDPKLVAGLQLLRDLVTSPIKISSAGRCPTEHEANPGYHLVTRNHPSSAADCIFPNLSLLEAYHAALEIPVFMYGGIGIYPIETDPNKGFLHLDTRPYFARWGRIQAYGTPYIKHQPALDWMFDALAGRGFDMEKHDIKQGQYTYSVPYWVGQKEF